MSSGGRSEVFFQIKRASLEVFAEGKEPSVLTFLPDAVVAGEVKAPAKFSSQLADFLIANKLANFDALIGLTDEVTYEKKLSSSDLKPETEKFLSELPLPADKIAFKFYNLKDNKMLVAVEDEIFRLIMEQVKKVGGTVLAVVPIIAWGVPAIGPNDFKKLLANKPLLRPLSFTEVTAKPETFLTKIKNLWPKA